jgi:hypothetical protein
MGVEGEPFPTDQRNGTQRTAYTPDEQNALTELISDFDVPDTIVVQVCERCNRDVTTAREALNAF